MKKTKYKIGYTTGVFDMFHIGHLNLLKNAKANCDYLIVGVSTDELVENYKNKTPVIPYEQRIEIVKAIRYVDEVVPQINREKFEAWKKYKFDIMFVGDDWKNSEIFSKVEKQLKEVNVEVKYFKYTEGISSTILREKIERKS